MKRVLKNDDISILSNFLVTFFNVFLDIEKFYQILSTCQISNQLDHLNRNYRRGQNESAPSSPAIPFCKKSGLFRVNYASLER